jgi:hypothetical protein
MAMDVSHRMGLCNVDVGDGMGLVVATLLTRGIINGSYQEYQDDTLLRRSQPKQKEDRKLSGVRILNCHTGVESRYHRCAYLQNLPPAFARPSGRRGWTAGLDHKLHG